MSQDDLSSIRPRARPRLFVTLVMVQQIEAGGPMTHPGRGDIWM
jgi:hypothetical protein